MIAHNVLSPFVSCVVETIRCRAVFYDASIRADVILQMFPARMSNAKRICGARILTPIDLGPQLPLVEALGSNKDTIVSFFVFVISSLLESEQIR
jgi:hypothetical protein